MTSLKNYTGDEIAAALAEQLSNEEFVGLYRKAEDAWWTKGPTAQAFKNEVDMAKTPQQVDAVQNKYLGGGTLTTQLAQEGIDDHAPLRDYATVKAGSLERVADDGQAVDDPIAPQFITEKEVYEMTGVKPKVETEVDPEKLVGPSRPPIKQQVDPEEPPAADQCAHGPEGTCQQCLEAGTPGMAVAVDFANRHLAKIAGALDAAGFISLADEIDALSVKFAAKKKKKDEEEKEEKKGKKKGKKKEEKENGEEDEEEQDAKDKGKKKKVSKKKKHRGRSYDEWVTFFNKKGKKVGEKFRKVFKGALKHAKGEGMKGDKAEEYAMRTALDKMPKSYFKEPGPEHGPGKSAPLVAKRPKKKKAADEQQVKTAQPPYAEYPEDAPLRERAQKPSSLWEELKGDWAKWWEGFRGKPAAPPKGEVTFDPKKVVVERPVPPRRRPSSLVKQVQALLLKAGLPVGSRTGKPDGLFGRTTASSWKAFLDKAKAGEDVPRSRPSAAAMRYVVQYGPQLLANYKAPEYGYAKPAPAAKPKPAAKPRPAAKSKPVPQAVGHEPTPEEWAKMDAGERRQYELAKRMREMGGGDVRTYRPGR